MIRNFILIYFLVSIFIITSFSSYLLGKIKNNKSRLFFIFTTCFFVYLSGYFLEYISTSWEEMLFWNHFQYLTIPFIPTLWLLIILEYTDRWIQTINNKLLVILILIIPVITVILNFTNSYHGLYYSSTTIIKSFGHNVLKINKGPWYYIQTAYIFLCLLISLFLVYQKFTFDKSRKKLLSIMFISLILPLLGILLNIIDIFKNAFDYGVLFISISIMLNIIAILKYDFLEITSTAKDRLFEISSDGLMVLDNDNNILDLNLSAMKLFNISQKKLLPYNIDKFLSNEPDLNKILKNADKVVWVKSLGKKDYHFEITTVEIKNKFTNKIGYLKTIRNITEEEELKTKLELLATTDTLTKINNRFKFMELAEREFQLSKRYKRTFAVLMVDIDHFKKINDNYGHAVGDIVLKNLGVLMKNHFRTTDILGRIGGEEFAIILVNTSLDDATKKAESFRQLVENTIVSVEELNVKFTVSIGLSQYNNGYQAFDEILKVADEALYYSKANGRNRITVYPE